MSVNLHPLADVQSKTIGKGTRIWQFCVVLPDAVIGQDCNICSHCFIENDVQVGNRVTVKCGVQLWDGITVEDDVFIGPNVTFTNDPYLLGFTIGSNAGCGEHCNVKRTSGNGRCRQPGIVIRYVDAVFQPALPDVLNANEMDK